MAVNSIISTSEMIFNTNHPVDLKSQRASSAISFTLDLKINHIIKSTTPQSAIMAAFFLSAIFLINRSTNIAMGINKHSSIIGLGSTTFSPYIDTPPTAVIALTFTVSPEQETKKAGQKTKTRHITESTLKTFLIVISFFSPLSSVYLRIIIILYTYTPNKTAFDTIV